MKNRILWTVVGVLLIAMAALPAGVWAADEDDAAGWADSVSVGFGLEWLKGNTEMLCYNYSLAYTAAFPEEWDLSLNLEGRYGETDNELSQANNKMALAVERILFRGNFSLYYNGDIEEDRFQNIYTRINSGIGIKLNFSPAWWVAFAASSVPVVDYTRTFDTMESEALWRLRSKASLLFKFDQETENNLKFEFIHQPDMKDFGDYRYEFNAALNLSVMGKLSFQNAFKMEHVSRPLGSEYIEVQKKNYSVTSSLTLSL